MTERAVNVRTCNVPHLHISLAISTCFRFFFRIDASHPWNSAMRLKLHREQWLEKSLHGTCCLLSEFTSIMVLVWTLFEVKTSPHHSQNKALTEVLCFFLCFPFTVLSLCGCCCSFQAAFNGTACEDCGSAESYSDTCSESRSTSPCCILFVSKFDSYYAVEWMLFLIFFILPCFSCWKTTRNHLFQL